MPIDHLETNERPQSPETPEAQTIALFRDLREAVNQHPGAETRTQENKGEITTTTSINLSKDEEWPETVTFTRTEPKTGIPSKDKPVTTTIIHKRRAKGSKDVYNTKREIEFFNPPGAERVAIKKAEENTVGTRTIYADSNTRYHSYDSFSQLPEQLKLGRKILARIQPAET